MLLITGTFRIAADGLPQARSAMQRMIDASRAEDGCVYYHYAVDLADPGLIHVSEAWANEEAFARHIASDHLSAWRAEWPRLGISDRQLQRYHVNSAQPC